MLAKRRPLVRFKRRGIQPIWIGAAVAFVSVLLLLFMGFSSMSGPRSTPPADKLLKLFFAHTKDHPRVPMHKEFSEVLKIVAYAIQQGKLDPKSVAAVMHVLRTEKTVLEPVLAAYTVRFCDNPKEVRCQQLALLLDDAMYGSLAAPQNIEARSVFADQLAKLDGADRSNSRPAREEAFNEILIYYKDYIGRLEKKNKGRDPFNRQVSKSTPEATIHEIRRALQMSQAPASR